MVPVIVIGLLEGATSWVYALLALCMISDFLDGMLARSRGERTKLGAFLDPMADKLLLISVFMTLAFLRHVPMWIFVVILSRDVFIIIGWSVIYILTGSNVVEPRPLGKITTAIQMVAALACILPLSFYTITRPMLLTAVIFTVASTIDYIIIGEKKLGAWM
jgi:cardiolipin synthase (CMP-forming)